MAGKPAGLGHGDAYQYAEHAALAMPKAINNRQRAASTHGIRRTFIVVWMHPA
jgi:hypothetical protein